MLLLSPRQLSVRFFSLAARALARVAEAIKARPRLAAWFYPSKDDTAESRYRAFNTWYFAGFFEQERMLADNPRMDFYHAAIARHVHPGDRVIDLGTGTGILAAMASRRGAAQVYAIDHSEIIDQAKALAAANGVQQVEFVSMHSTDFDVPGKVDVILHEQMGDYLFDEMMVANVTDLRDRVLKPGGLIIPSRFELYCEPIQVRDDRVVPFIWELNVHGFDYSSLERSRPQDPGYYHLRSSDLGLIEGFIGEPEPLLTLDLASVVEDDLPRDFIFTRTVGKTARLDGYVVFFKARVDADLCLSTSPVEGGRAPHWGFRILRTEQDSLAGGDVIQVRFSVDRWSDPNSWRWSHVKNPGASDAAQAAEVERSDS